MSTPHRFDKTLFEATMTGLRQMEACGILLLGVFVTHLANEPYLTLNTAPSDISSGWLTTANLLEPSRTTSVRRKQGV